METAILTILCIVALVILRYAIRLERQDTQRRVRSYRADVVRQAARRGGDLESDCLHIWRLKCEGQTASRRAVTSRGEMSYARWNKASALITHLKLDPAQTGYRQGAERIRDYVAEQQRLASGATFVPPTD